MKKKLKSLFCMTLAVAMVFSLAACGDKNADEKTPGNNENEVKPETVYVPEFTKIDPEGRESIRILSADADKIYCSAVTNVGENIPEGAVKEYEGQFDVYEESLYTMDASGKLTELPAYEISASDPEDAAGKKDYSARSYIVSAIPAEDGKLVCVESISTSWFDGDDDVQFGSEEYWEHQAYEERYVARVLNPDGSEVSSFDIPAEENSSIYSIAQDKDGNIVLAGNGIRAIDANGEVAYDIPADDYYIERLIKVPDGRLLAYFYGENGPAVSEIDGAGKKLGEPVDLPRFANEVYPGGEDYELYYTSGLNFYGLNIGQEPVKLFNWMNADVNSDSVRNIVAGPDGSFVALSSEWDNQSNKSTYELVKLTKKPYDSVAQKEELTLAVMWLDYDFKDTIIKYNRSNDKYRVVIKDYSEFNTEDDWEAGKTKLLTEIMSGEMPDMLALDGLPYSQLLSKGIIEDIYPYIDADPEFDREDFQQNFFKALEVDGKLGQVCSDFIITTAVGPAKAVGDQPGWNYAQFNEALAQMPEGCKPFGHYVQRDDIMHIQLAMDMDYFADWTTGECRFDTPEFAELLEFAKQFPKEVNYDEDIASNTVENFASGMQMLSFTAISMFDDLLYNDAYTGGDAVYIGIPSASGTGSAFSAGNGYAITKNCSNKEAAWDFLRTLLTEEYQNKIMIGLPTNIKVFDAKLEQAMTPEYRKDAEGNFMLDENGDKIPVSHGGYGMPDGTVVEMYNLTQEQADKFMDLLNSTEKLYDENSQLADIVIENAAPFFEGQKSAEEVSKLIQSKVNIYINEQR